MRISAERGIVTPPKPVVEQSAAASGHAGAAECPGTTGAPSGVGSAVDEVSPTPTVKVSRAPSAADFNASSQILNVRFGVVRTQPPSRNAPTACLSGAMARTTTQTGRHLSSAGEHHVVRLAADAAERLGATGYLTDAATATTAYLAGALEKPLLVEGPAGVGKTELAKAVGRAVGAELVRLQCYEGLDEARALYEWNYKKQLLFIQARHASDADVDHRTQPREDWDHSIFTEEFLLTRPLLTAIRRDQPTVLLVDEVDKTDVEVEGLLLEILSDFQVTVRSSAPCPPYAVPSSS